MRKFSKIVLGAAAVLGVAGLGLTAGGVAMGATMDDMRYEGSSVQKVVNRMVRAVSYTHLDVYKRQSSGLQQWTVNSYLIISYMVIFDICIPDYNF